MSYLLDTCILSKLRTLSQHPDEQLKGWLDERPDHLYHISTLSIGEIHRGIELLNRSPEQIQKKRILEDWLHGALIPRFAGRILSIDIKVGLMWGQINAETRRKGTPLPVVDGLIAATALHHGLIVVTNNVRDFEPSGVALFNPCEPVLLKQQ